MIREVKQLGQFMTDSGIPGETRNDGAYPAMGGAMQLSQNRWLTLFSTRGFLGPDDGLRGTDNDRSILYVLRDSVQSNTVINSGILKRYQTDWDVLGDGKANLMQHCHTGGWGVPKGALIGGKRVSHENVFVAAWYRTPRAMGRALANEEERWDNLCSEEYEKQLYEKAFAIEWMQFRLNDAENDIEILQPPKKMRQVGYEIGEQFCSMHPTCKMNRWYVPPVPYNDEHSEWVQVPHFQFGIAAVRFAFSHATGLYEWVQTGPLLHTGEQNGLNVSEGGIQLTETSTIRYNDSWLIAARSAERSSKTVRGVAWMRTDDLFKPLPEPVYPGMPMSKSPCAAFTCPDGQLRLFTNDISATDSGDDRNPLFVWEVDPDNGYALSNRHTVFNADDANIRSRDLSWPRVDMPNLIPHAGGDQQIVTCRVRIRRRKYPYSRITEQERADTGWYHSIIHYDEPLSAAWQFE